MHEVSHRSYISMSLKHNLQVSVRLKVASKLEHVFEAFFFQNKMFQFTVRIVCNKLCL